jgi:hypothetical protein
MKLYLIKILRLDPMENGADNAAHYETIGATSDPTVLAFIEQQAEKDVVDPSDCWALQSAVMWPRPIKRWLLEPIPRVDIVPQAEELLSRARQGLL